MIQAGGKLNAAYVKEYVDFAKQNNKEFIVMYGQTEAAPRMAYLPFDKAIEKNASIGIAIPGGKLCIVNANGKNIKEPEVEGELVYKGENVCLGYAENAWILEREMKTMVNFIQVTLLNLTQMVFSTLPAA